MINFFRNQIYVIEMFYFINNVIVLDPDLGWTDWTDWSECDKSCGGGEQRRARTCTNKTPTGNGGPCDGEATETRKCNSHECTYFLSLSDFYRIKITPQVLSNYHFN